MKKLIFLVFIVAFTLNLSQINASNPDKKKITQKEITKEASKLTEAEANAMMVRLMEIKEMDTKSLTGDQKRELRKEVRDIRDKLKTNDGFSIYIGGGALLVIILLILLL
jgi:uncharacterized membrane protein